MQCHEGMDAIQQCINYPLTHILPISHMLD